MYTIKDKFNELLAFYNKTKNENSLLYIYRNIRFYIQENGPVSFFEDVVPFIEDLNFNEYTVASNMMNEIEKFALEFENNKMKEEIKYVLLKCNTFEIKEIEKEEKTDNDNKKNEQHIFDVKPIVKNDKSNNAAKKDTDQNDSIDDNIDESIDENSKNSIERPKKVLKDSDSYSDFGSDDLYFSESREYSNLYTQAEMQGDYKELIYVGLSKMLKPLLKFKAKEGVNLMVHFALKTNTSVLSELLEIYKEKKDWQIEILLFIAYINKKLEKEYQTEITSCKSLLKEFIEMNRANDSNFIICKLFFFLEIHYDSEMYFFWKTIVCQKIANASFIALKTLIGY